jgi:hypothetical protein
MELTRAANLCEGCTTCPRLRIPTLTALLIIGRLLKKFAALKI